MNSNRFRGSDLNELCRLARSGDESAATQFFSLLRVRFLQIAKHRVPKDDAEDIVQEGLRIVHTKLDSRSSSEGTLSWCLSILRNVVGNYYKKHKRQKGDIDFDEAIHSSSSNEVSGGRDRESVVDGLQRGLTLLSDSHPRCGVFFRSILSSLNEPGEGQESSQRTLARIQVEYPEMTANSFYVALHRCRKRLREILIELARGGGSS